MMQPKRFKIECESRGSLGVFGRSLGFGRRKPKSRNAAPALMNWSSSLANVAAWAAPARIGG